MDKLILSGSFDNMSDPPAQLMDVHSRGVDRAWMQKRAAALTQEIATVLPQPGYTHVHLIALGDGETYGPNRNADYFSKHANSTRHHTFVKNGHVYKHHQNKDPKKASGIVKFSAYNEPMARVELVVALDNNKWGKELEKLASGGDIPFSMACKVAYDRCMICNNKSRTREEYCDHMKKYACQIFENGKQACVDNPNPTFFDISGVFKPADRIAYSLQKVASANRTITGAELAEMEGITKVSSPVLQKSHKYFKKMALLHKLSDIEKEIEGVVRGDDPENGSVVGLRGAFSPSMCCELEDSDVGKLTKASNRDLQTVLNALGDAKISLPLRDFLKIVMGDDFNLSDENSVKKMLPGIFSDVISTGDSDEIACDGSYDMGSNGIFGRFGSVGGMIGDVINKIVPMMSLSEAPVGKRIMIVSVKGLPKPGLSLPGIFNTIKTSSDKKSCKLLANEYAKYKLSLLTKFAEDNDWLAVRLGVLQNYLA